MSLKLADILSTDSRLFAKSEFGPATADWPALSFSSPKIAREFGQVSRRGKDFIIFVGTSNPNDTPDPTHRQRLMSVVDVEPRAIVQTKQIVSPDSWARAQSNYPGRWDYSLRLARAWTIEGFPRAHEKLPETYSKFRNPGTRGHPIVVEEADYISLNSIELRPVELNNTDSAEKILNINIDDSSLRKEISRLVGLIQHDVDRSMSARDGYYPFRFAPNMSEVFSILSDKWKNQGGVCPLCNKSIPILSRNKLLAMSRDRIDSSIKEYSLENTQITHLGCNLAKSDVAMEDWIEYREMLVS